MRYTLLLICIVGFFSLTEAQTYSTKNKKAIALFETALKSYQRYDYETALSYADMAVKQDKKFWEAYFLKAEVYFDLTQYDKSLELYTYILAQQPSFNANLYYMAAQCNMRLGKYADAKKNLESFIEQKGVDMISKERAKKYINTCNFAIVQLEHPVPFNPENLGPNVNSAHAEYLPTLTADEQTLIITVRRPRDMYTENLNSEEEDFYISKKLDGEWSKAFPIGPPVNTHGNEGAQAIAPDGSILVFTGCQRKDGYGSCDLYISNKQGNSWTQPKNMGPLVNSAAWDSQPTISADGKTIFFSSSRPGGKGMSDIWKTVKNADGEWTKPVCLPDNINTSGVEQSPFIHPDDKTLYFASDGLQGMGGMDIFYTRKDSSGNWTTPVNMGYPINTFADENSLILNATGNWAYFSSDKLGGYGKHDLFMFELYEAARPEPVSFMKGMVYDDETKAKLYAKFELIDLQTANTIIESYSDSLTGAFLVCLPTSNDYALNVSKQGYLFFSEHFTIPAEARNKIEPYLKNVPLKPIKVGEAVVLKNIFFDFDKFELLKTSVIELDRLTALLKANPTMKIEIGGHTDSDGSDDYNRTLSENRARAVYGFLIEKGISKERLTYKGYGETKPIDDNATEAGRANNRRTEFKVIEK